MLYCGLLLHNSFLFIALFSHSDFFVLISQHSVKYTGKIELLVSRFAIYCYGLSYRQKPIRFHFAVDPHVFIHNCERWMNVKENKLHVLMQLGQKSLTGGGRSWNSNFNSNQDNHVPKTHQSMKYALHERTVVRAFSCFPPVFDLNVLFPPRLSMRPIEHHALHRTTQKKKLAASSKATVHC